MNSRRSFFRSLTAIVAASAMDALGWKMPPLPKTPLQMYEDAAYEEVVMWVGGRTPMWINKRPRRFDLEGGEFVERPFYEP